MSDRKSRKYRKKQRHPVLPWIIGFAVVFLTGILFGICEILGNDSNYKALDEDKAYFHFIDVGQGDATLITSGDKAVLVDTGSLSMADEITEYIKRYTREIDYLILTHPHEDHMGCAAQVLSLVEVKNVIMPDASSDDAYFSRFLDVAEEKEITLIEAEAGDTYRAGEINLTILAPLEEEYENINNYSITLRVDIGETSALFTGDGEKEVEEALLEQYTFQLDCDLFQAGHHGSNTSNSAEFVAAVSPSAAVISCGKDNSYGHPHSETLQTFKKFGVEVFRTDLMGDILFVSDGETITPCR